MTGEHEVDKYLLDFGQNDWNDLIEYTNDTDVDSSDGPREHDEEELMSPPPNLPNGGGGGGDGDTCPDELSYDNWDECRLYHDYETCADLCFGEYEEAGMSCEVKVGLLCVGGTSAVCWAVAAVTGITTGFGGLALAVICGLIAYGGCTYAQNEVCG